MRQLSKLRVPLVLLLLLVRIAVAAAEPVQASITGPDAIAAGTTATYVVEPAGQKLEIFSSFNLWIRSIVAKSGVKCALDDGASLDTITCDGPFKVSISSDQGQQVNLRLGELTKQISADGPTPVPDDSDIHIFNGLVPGVQAVAPTAADKPAILTNLLGGGYAAYLLTAINWESPITRTFDITLTIPLAVQMDVAPRDCALTLPGIYKCRYVVGPHTWLSHSFDVIIPARPGVYILNATGSVGHDVVGTNDRTINNIVVTDGVSRQFLSIMMR